MSLDAGNAANPLEHANEAFRIVSHLEQSAALSRGDSLRLGLTLLASPEHAHVHAAIPLLMAHINDPGVPVRDLANLALQAWKRGYAAETAAAATVAMRRNPNVGGLYRLLGMAQICLHEYERAFFTLGAGTAITGRADMHSIWQRLAHGLWRGVDAVEFAYNGHTYRFGLDIFGSQAMEAAAHHIGGRFTEQQELELLAREVGPGRRIVEMGTLVGNHTVFFLTEMSPASLFLIDGSTKSLGATRANIARNHGPQPPCPIHFVHRFVGLEAQDLVFNGEPVRQEPLDTILHGEVFDFIKIDADGMELDLLDGAMAVLSANRPDMLLEVETANREPALTRLAPLGYTVRATINHGDYENLLLKAGA